MDKLTTSEKQKFRAQAHKLKPVVMISEKGLTESVIKEIDQSLKAHELIKIRIFSDERGEREQLSKEICKQTNALEIQLIGKIFVIYRKKTIVFKPIAGKSTVSKAKKSTNKRATKVAAKKSIKRFSKGIERKD